MSSPTATAEPGRAPGGADPRRWVALAVVLTAGFMQLVDISIVNVAIPSIQRRGSASPGARPGSAVAVEVLMVVAPVHWGRAGRPGRGRGR